MHLVGAVEAAPAGYTLANIMLPDGASTSSQRYQNLRPYRFSTEPASAISVL